ncbi:hypothetical protein D3C72_1640190 [compost metagenome]
MVAVLEQQVHVAVLAVDAKVHHQREGTAFQAGFQGCGFGFQVIPVPIAGGVADTGLIEQLFVVPHRNRVHVARDGHLLAVILIGFYRTGDHVI